MSKPLFVREGVVIAADEITWTSARAGGPGGQNVNKVASKVELRFDLAATTAFGYGARMRLRALCVNRLDADGKILITSQKTRDQAKNLEDAREKLRELVLEALDPPKPRRPTKPTRASKRRRLDEKSHHGQKKKDRRGGDE